MAKPKELAGAEEHVPEIIMENIPIVLCDTSPGSWDDIDVDWLHECHVQARWSDNKWYDVMVLKLLKNGHFDCHFLSTGNEGIVPPERLRVAKTKQQQYISSGNVSGLPANLLEGQQRSLAWHMQHCNKNGKHTFLLE